MGGASTAIPADAVRHGAKGKVIMPGSGHLLRGQTMYLKLREGQTLDALAPAPAKLLGIADRAGSLEKGKDGDLALFDGDPFEFASHCVGTVINGVVVSEGEETRGPVR